MTKQEIKMVLTLIDRATVEKEVGYHQYSSYMPSENIIKLKEDIKDLFSEEDNA